MVWVAVATVLVFLMQAGFMFLEIGFSRQKNVGTGVAKILVNLAIVTLAWWVVGYGIAEGGSATSSLATSGFFFHFDQVVGRAKSVHRGRIRRDADAVRARLLRGLAGDRLGNHPGADQVRRLRDLRRRSSAR